MELSEVEENDPHFMGNQAHVYEFVEAVIRCGYRIYHHTSHERKKRQLSSHANAKSHDTHETVAQCLQSLLSEHILPHSCLHDSTDSTRWTLLETKTQSVLRKYKSSLEQVFRFFAVGRASRELQRQDQNKKVKGRTVHDSHQSTMTSYWKDRSKAILDDTMNFNEIYMLFDTLQLVGVNLNGTKLAKVYSHVTNDPAIIPSVHPDNAHSEMVLEEFMELLARLALASDDYRLPVMLGQSEDYHGGRGSHGDQLKSNIGASAGSTGGSRGAKRAVQDGPIDDKLETWLLKTFLSSAQSVMPRTVAKEFKSNAAQKASLRVEEEEPEAVRKRRSAIKGGSTIFMRDVRGDGSIDRVELDTTGDGQVDSVGYDTTGDGKIDSYDTSGDGQIDTTM